MVSERDRAASVLGALASATDLANGYHPEKAVRTALVAQRLASVHGLDAVQQADAYRLALLRSLGCTAFAHEEAHHYGGGDDISVRSVMGFVDPSEPVDRVRGIVTGVGRGAPLAARARGIVNLLTDRSVARSQAQAQCDVGDALARRLGMPEHLLDALGDLFERWDGTGHPAGKAGDASALSARIVAAADVLELAHSRHGRDAAVATAGRRSGGRLDPDVVHTFCAHAAEVLEGLSSSSMWDEFLAAEPEPVERVSPALVDRCAEVFARAVDLKSVWTATHSYDVGVLAAAAGQAARLDADAVRRLRLGGWLHDLGRLAVSNRIWDKPGSLDEAEREQVRRHAYQSERLLARSPALVPVAALAGATHERADGSGYPRGVPLAMLDVPARILAACDVFCALREARPHRSANSTDSAVQTLGAMAGRGTLDTTAVRHVADAAGVVVADRHASPVGLTDREVEVLRLVARGATTKDVARALEVPPRSVPHEVASTCAKVGVRSRGGAALFAAEHRITAPSA